MTRPWHWFVIGWAAAWMAAALINHLTVLLARR